MMKPIRLTFVVSFCLYGFGLFGQQPTYLSQQFSGKIIPLTVSAGDSARDYATVAESLKDYRLIGLGEASHGTKDFFEAKAEIIMALVESGDIKTVFFETEYGGFAPFNEFIHDSNRTDTENAFRESGMYDVFKCEEVLSLMVCLKSYNLRQPPREQVSIYGIDMQYAFVSARRIKDLLSDDDGLEGQHLKTLSNIDSLTWNHFYDRNKIRWDKKTNAALIARLLEIAESKKEWELDFCIRLLEQSLDMFYTGKRKMGALRDRFMAENILWLRDRLEIHTPSTVWAHNGHITYSAFVNTKNMGYYLKEALGDDYYALAFAFDKGEVSMVTHEVVYYPTVTNRKAIEYHLRSVDQSDFFLDFSQLKKDAILSKRLSKIKYMRVVGSHPMPSKSGLNLFRWFDGFDGMIFMHETEASEKLIRR